MSSTVDIERIERDARQAVNQDGLTYLFLGMLLFLVGISLTSSKLSWIAVLGILFILPVNWLRKRITYPRIGYVQFKMPDGMARSMLAFVVVAVVVLSAIAFLAPRLLSVVIGLVFALAMYFGMSLTGIRWRDWLGIALTLAGGFVTAWAFEDWHMAVAVELCLVATLLILMGILDLIGFLRTHPIITEEAPADIGEV